MNLRLCFNCFPKLFPALDGSRFGEAKALGRVSLAALRVCHTLLLDQQRDKKEVEMGFEVLWFLTTVTLTHHDLFSSPISLGVGSGLHFSITSKHLSVPFLLPWSQQRKKPRC